MKAKSRIKCALLVTMVFMSTTYSKAQKSKVAVIFTADTTVIHQHVGLTLFNSFTDTLDFNFPTRAYITNQLKGHLSEKFELSFINQLPDSVLLGKKGVFGEFTRLRKSFKNWLLMIKDQYDWIIIIDNLTIPYEFNLLIPNYTSGLYSRTGSAAYYTTITFVLFQASSLEEKEYYYLGGPLTSPIKKFKLPKDKRSFSPEEKEFLKEGFVNYLDSRIEYFLTKTYLTPPPPKIKTKKRTNQ